MSEYQYYEFVAIDRSLTKKEQSELRSCSSRARITSTHFVNEYHWGDLKGDPVEWMKKYFDAHVYLSNFGSLAVHLRLPLSLLGPASTRRYEEIPSLEVRRTATHVILSFLSEEQSGGYYEDDDGGSLILSSILPAREELARGDMRALYLAWLVSVQSREVEEDDLGPPVPPGLGELSDAQQSLAEFLKIDPDLITAAARFSHPLQSAKPSPKDARDWLARLSASEKDDWLLRMAVEDGSQAVREFQRAFVLSKNPPGDRPPEQGADKLLVSAEEITRIREKAEAEEAAAERLAYLRSLSGQEENMWKSIFTLTTTATQSNAISAVKQLTDLRDLAALTGASQLFSNRLAEFRDLRSRKSSLIARLNAAGLI